jgi:hypothetical protein
MTLSWEQSLITSLAELSREVVEAGHNFTMHYNAARRFTHIWESPDGLSRKCNVSYSEKATKGEH